MKYQRFISYLYQYREGQKLANTGFVKVEQKGVLVRISVRCKILERDPEPYGIYLITKQAEESGEHYGVLLSQQKPAQGMLTYQYTAGKEGDIIYALSMEDYLGVILRGQKGIYMTIWQDVQVDPDCIICGEEVGENPGRILTGVEAFAAVAEIQDIGNSAEGSAMQTTMEAAEENAMQTAMQEAAEENKVQTDGQDPADLKVVQDHEKEGMKTTSSAGDIGVDYLFEKRQPLPPVEGGQLVDCIRIDPKDLGLLPMPNWKYGTNSFLSHGYYKYRYLLLGKIRFQDDSLKLILGVPSIYTNREKYLANMFGFDQFVTAKRTDRKLGQFGYWIVELTP